MYYNNEILLHTISCEAFLYKKIHFGADILYKMRYTKTVKMNMLNKRLNVQLFSLKPIWNTRYYFEGGVSLWVQELS